MNVAVKIPDVGYTRCMVIASGRGPSKEEIRNFIEKADYE